MEDQPEMMHFVDKRDIPIPKPQALIDGALLVGESVNYDKRYDLRPQEVQETAEEQESVQFKISTQQEIQK